MQSSINQKDTHVEARKKPITSLASLLADIVCDTYLLTTYLISHASTKAVKSMRFTGYVTKIGAVIHEYKHMKQNEEHEQKTEGTMYNK